MTADESDAAVLRRPVDVPADLFVVPDTSPGVKRCCATHSGAGSATAGHALGLLLVVSPVSSSGVRSRRWGR